MSLVYQPTFVEANELSSSALMMVNEFPFISRLPPSLSLLSLHRQRFGKGKEQARESVMGGMALVSAVVWGWRRVKQNRAGVCRRGSAYASTPVSASASFCPRCVREAVSRRKMSRARRGDCPIRARADLGQCWLSARELGT